MPLTAAAHCVCCRYLLAEKFAEASRTSAKEAAAGSADEEAASSDKAYSSPKPSREAILHEEKITEVLKTVEREASSKHLKAAAQAVQFANRAASANGAGLLSKSL